MLQLTPIESRVLGVLVEKDKTTPEQYPLSLNAIVNGCNQKNNRDPVTSISDNDAFTALESLREKHLIIRMDAPGSRVNKYRHNFAEVFRLRTGEVALLAELLLRGPQTLGELRGRASRMHPIESLDEVKDLLRAMMERDEPLVQQLPPSPGSRAERYAQLLSPDLHPMNSTAAETNSGAPAQGESITLLQRVERLELEVARLTEIVGRFETLRQS